METTRETNMKRVLSKEILHEPMKEIDTRYTKWLDDHKSSLCEEHYDIYSQQYKLIKELSQVCDRDSANITKIAELRHEIKKCGPLPTDIVQELAPHLGGQCIIDYLVRATCGTLNMSSQSSEGCHRYLPTEVLREILLQLPSFKLVCRFRSVSKLWKSLLYDPYFLEKISRILLSKIPWILMYDPSHLRRQLYPNQDAQKFINRHHGGLSFDFLLGTNPFDGQKLEKVCILDSCSNGLVLCSPFDVVYDERVIAVEDRSINKFLLICNPLTKEWIALPPRPVSNSKDVFNCCTKLLSESETVGQYTVVHVYGESDTSSDNLCFQIFSSDSGEWKTFFSPRTLWMNIVFWGFSTMVIRHGVLYWTAKVDGPDRQREVLIGYSILDNIEEAEDRYTSMDLPLKIDQVYEDGNRAVLSFFGESKGSVLYYGVVEYSAAEFKAFLSVYRIDQDDSDRGLFNCTAVHSNIELRDYSSSEIEAVCMDPVNPNVIIIVQWGCALAYDITTLTHEVLRGSPIPEISEHKMSLPPILIRPRLTVIPPLLN